MKTGKPLSEVLFPEELRVGSEEYKERLAEAVQAYGARPKGHSDKGGKWYPALSEEASCCKGVRSPSRAWPLSLLKHCETYHHVSTRFCVKKQDLINAVRLHKAEMVVLKSAGVVK